jgi:hypothetical protein
MQKSVTGLVTVEIDDPPVLRLVRSHATCNQ